MVKWTDSTSYSRDQKDRTPTSWTAKVGDISVTVTKAHRRNPGKWTMHCHALGMDTVCTGLPDTVDPETAQFAAKNMASSKARGIASELSKL